MKQIEISEIMDEYVDNDLFFDGESEINTEAVKSKTFGKIQGLSIAPKKKIKRPAKIIAAVAAAALCLSAVSVAADLPERFFGSIRGKTNAVVTLNRGNINWDFDDVTDPFEYRNGRIIFTAMGGEEDITDLIDDETPYIASYVSYETGLTNYIAIGGEPGHTGFQEFINFGTEEEPCWSGYGVFAQKGFPVSVYGVGIEYCGLAFDEIGELEKSDIAHYKEDGYSMEELDAKFVKTFDAEARMMPWAVNAAKEINVLEARERMENNPYFTDRDADFIHMVLGGGLIFMDESHDFDAEDFERIYGADISLVGSSPLEVKDGRIIASVNGTEKDITDIVDDNTPYIEAIEGAPCEAWLIAGGTAENCKGVVVYNIASNTLADNERGFRLIDRANNLIALGDKIDTDNYFAVDGEEISYEQLKDYLMQGVDLTGRFSLGNSMPQWYSAACEQLAIDGHLNYAE